ncbi:MAG: hypothetical protein ABFD75_12285 [Smithella sp.]
MQIDQDTITIVLGALLAVSEALSLIPAVKSNGIFQGIVDIVKVLAGKKDPK